MSIADGQTVLRHAVGGDVDTEGVAVDARLSVSRIGSRAFPPALEALAPQIRCAATVLHPFVGHT
jgi:F0F1-type ATP synthase alpha subunit